MRSFNKFLITIASVPLALSAQSGGLGGPIIGLVVDSSARLRPVLGVPGSATLGNPMALDAGLKVAAISPRQNYALAIRGDQRELAIVRDLFGAGSITAVAGISGAGRVSLSPTGSSAVVQSSDGLTAQVITGLPDSPVLAFQADLSVLPATPSALAVSDDAKSLLAAASDADHTSIFLITADAGGRVIASAGQIGGLAFVTRRSDAIFIDSTTNQASILRGLADSPTASLLLDGSSGGSRMVDIAGSEDGASAFVAIDGGVTIVDTASGAQRSVTCECNPAALSRLSRSQVFLLTDSTAGGLLWIFDGGGSNPRIVAIPPDPAGAEVTQ